MFDLDTLPSGEELTAFLADTDDETLSSIQEALQASMRETFNDGNGTSGDGVSPEELTALETMGDQLSAVESAQETRTNERDERASRAANVMSRFAGDGDNSDDGGDADENADDNGGSDGGANDGEGDANVELETESGRTLVASLTRLLDVASDSMIGAPGAGGRDLNRHIRLRDIAAHAPDAQVPQNREESVLIASADIHPFTQGGELHGYSELAKAVHTRAKSMGLGKAGPAAERKVVASLERKFKYEIGRQPTRDQVDTILKQAADVENLVASGGWCSPSEIDYSFFSIIAQTGALDLPSVGTAERGGIQMTRSLSFGDVIDSPGLWTWTEQDDIDAASSDSVFKPCVRVPCPDFLDVRLLCDGLCVTAGNLQDWSYRESIEDFLMKLMAARMHLTNARIIDILVNGGTTPDDIGPSIPVDHTGTALTGNAAAKLLQSVELSAIDYRTRFRMDREAILEVVFPEWIVGPIKADLSNRMGVDFLAVTNAMVANWFNLKNVRVQFVQDWQTDLVGEIGGPTPATSWPADVDYLIYAPGTFVRANGLSLDLGVIRDSELNATNDHTAAFIEDCYMIHKPGHESRVVTVDLCTAGNTGLNDIVCV